MSFDGNGTFVRIMNWVQDAAALINIKADRHDQQDDDFAAGLTNCLTKDGQSQPTRDLPMNGKKLINLGAPVNAGDSANKAYVDAVKTFATGLVISGADVNGQLKFSSATGANGLTFTGADLSWLARLATAAGPGTPPVPPATANRLVLNTKPDGSGTDVVTVNDDGSIVATGSITASPTHISKAATGNVNFWLQGPAGEDRMVLYTSAASAGNTILRVTNTQSFTFGTDGTFRAPSHLYAGNNAAMDTNGNVQGSIWDPWGAHDANTAISNQIETRAQAWANDRVAGINLQRAAITFSGNVGSPTGWISPPGCVIVGYARDVGSSGPVYGLYYATLQIYDPVNGWRNMGG